MSSVPDQPAEPTGNLPPTLTAAAPTRRTPSEVTKHRFALAAEVKKLIRKKPNLRMIIEGKKYPLAPVWIFVAACDGVTAMVTKTEELLTDNREEMGYLAVAHAVDSTGRILSGAEARCLCGEPDWQGKPSAQICSMSETRAVSKVHSLLYKDVMVLAGFEPTPAEEMGKPPGARREREITTPCNDCGNKVSKKRALSSRRQWGKELCLACDKIMREKQADAVTAPLNDPRQVAEFVATTKQRKANGGQPVAQLLDEAESIA